MSGSCLLSYNNFLLWGVGNLIFCKCFIAIRMIRQCHGIDENQEQGLITRNKA
jgi:hypothetical protein